ncbi:LptF/LptG family permease [Cecembia calidifontis]|jgi:lipopolysaccharide export system permease protein|uniref:Lipopolysaccharide export system permease protein n=1 Tax=Cecembia calidifontis TaxID=1187080 RepID=A0A4Q7PCH9_9BACT|nr:LptF/LptG family permease [Cecembia calidifontis]RZS97747.1 lipopolysaccharide export system permease protein [Cecembia calidifontis]
MKKLDKLILGSFIGPFFLTFVVVDFILLTVNMLKYFDEIFGKGLGFMIYMELISYFVISISPMALPLAVLLSSLMTFGNLGEHFELTAIKASGISLLRALRPIGIFVVVLTILAYLSNNYLVPKVNLKTFSLLYDIRMKSPALDIKEGVFYAGIPNYSIKVNQKLDDVRLKDIIIYDHSEGQGNTNVILADSGRMESFMNDRYMRLVLFNGVSYKESRSSRGINEKPVDFSRTNFSQNEMIFNLESFQLNRTPEDLWSTNRSIMNIAQLRQGLDSIAGEVNSIIYYNYATIESSYSFFGRNQKIKPPRDISEKKARYDSLRSVRIREREANKLVSPKITATTSAIDSVQLIEIPGSGTDSVVTDIVDAAVDETSNKGVAVQIDQKVSGSEKLLEAKISRVKSAQQPRQQENGQQVISVDTVKQAPKAQATLTEFTPEMRAKLDSIIDQFNYKSRGATVAMNNARSIKNNFSSKLAQIDNLEREYRRFQIAWYQKYTTAFACIVMFLIGAPLGAIIKKGGLGMPVLVSIIFFIIYYMLTITGEKWAKEGITDPLFGTWFSNIVLLPIGFFFLKQARRDARLFEADMYLEFFKKLRKRFQTKFSKT